MDWIIAMFISFTILILFRFFVDMRKDRIDLEKQSITEKFNFIVSIINNYAFYGNGRIYSYNKTKFSIYEDEKNQIIKLEYLGGNLLIEWRYKYFHKEVVYKKTFKGNRNYSLVVQLKIADEIIREIETIINNHKKKVINDINPDPILVNELEMLDKIERQNFLEDTSHQPEFGHFIDIRDNYKYKTIKIGNQVWMAENLRFIPDDNSLKFNKDIFVYNYSGEKKEEAMYTQEYKDYGCLYGFKSLGFVCPPGWHIPSDNEWSSLFFNLGGINIAVLKLISNNGHFQNNSIKDCGFSALAGGRRFVDEFCDIKSMGYWWSTTTPKGFVSGSTSMYWHIDFNKYIIGNSLGLGSSFYSVRCIKDY